MQEAIAAAERGDLPRADHLFRQLLETARDDAHAVGEYGRFCLLTDRFGAACYLLSRAIHLSPENLEFRIMLGYTELESGRAEDARRSFDFVLQRSPAHPAASEGFARCCSQRGLWREAVEAFKVALQGQPTRVDLLAGLATACQQDGDMRSAGELFRRAEQLAPDEPFVLLEHGRFLLSQGSYESALERLERCARLRPDDPDVLLATCRCLYGMGQRERALALFERTARIARDLPDLHEEFGNCLTEPAESGDRDLHWGLAADQWLRMRNSARLLPLLEKMLAANPSNATAWNIKGLHYVLLKQTDVAEAAFKHAIEADPGWLDAHANLANLYETTNRVSEAQAIAEAAPQVESEKYDLLSDSCVLVELVLARVARRRKDYALAMRHHLRIDRMQRKPLQREIALFERGQMLDQAGDPAAAMAAFSEANSLGKIRWITANPGNNKFMEAVDQLTELVARGWARQWRPTGAPPPTIAPVFLGGFPRSGTTLLNQVLGSRDDVQILEEEPTFAAILDVVRTMPRGYANSVREFDAFDIEYLRRRYFAEVEKHVAPSPSRVLVDKLPFHLAQAGLIHRVFPESKFIFAIRHPCDAILSCLMQNFGDNEAMANFFKLKDAVALYTRTMDLWEAYQRDLPIRVYRLRYEDLVDDLEGESRKLCEFLQLDWQDAMLQFSTKALDRGRITTPSYHQVSRPIYRESRFRWERYRNYLLPYLPALRPYIVRLGYPDPMHAS